MSNHYLQSLNKNSLAETLIGFSVLGKRNMYWGVSAGGGGVSVFGQWDGWGVG